MGIFMRGLLKELAGIGPILPGTLETRQRPLKDTGRRKRKNAGVFHVLSYSVKGHNSSMYVKNEDIVAVAEMAANYSRARELIIEIGLKMVSACRDNGVSRAVAAWDGLMPKAVRGDEGGGSGARQLRVLQKSRDKWKGSSLKHSKELAGQRVANRDLSASRREWKSKAMYARRKAKEDAAELRKLKSQIAELELKLDGVKKNSPLAG